MVDTKNPVQETQEQTIEIIKPEIINIDETIGKDLGTFQKIVEEQIFDDEKMQNIITKKIVDMSDEEIIETKTIILKKKVALGTATTTDKADLKLLIG